MNQIEPNFFITGGILGPNAECYVKRKADVDLNEALEEGEFCYVLASRLMGKSSLMVRAEQSLRKKDYDVAVVDLQALGHNITCDQWYDGLACVLGRKLGMEEEFENYYNCHVDQGPAKSFFLTIRNLALPSIKQKLVIFLDEFDFYRCLPFSVDEFLSGMRECYDRRSEDAIYRRLNFCLLGEATLSELTKESTKNPFIIGRQIQLTDFTIEEAETLFRQLWSNSDEMRRLGERILYWTNGHPYLTKGFCRAVASNKVDGSVDEIDSCCGNIFLDSGAMDRDENLRYIRRMLLEESSDRSGLLQLYQRIYNQEVVYDDETQSLVRILKLLGIIKSVCGKLNLRNRIYQKVFNNTWIDSNHPISLPPNNHS